ncbi:hypothetical protein GCM10010517_25900 [Streptosporangium fragile]|uniref:ERCC4 domain-containing protein n=1 Tax=Streptosporangium fragile TaxID=46186 RepID=A0ABN3VW29_9ACTN
MPRADGTWPREKAVYCYPAGPDEWPDNPDEVERAGVRSCVRRGTAIGLVPDRARENRSQIVFTTARGRDTIFWQTARVREQAETTTRRLACGDYAVEAGSRIHAAVERKSLADLVSSLLGGRLKYQLTELATLSRAAVVVEDRYSQVFKLRDQNFVMAFWTATASPICVIRPPASAIPSRNVTDLPVSTNAARSHLSSSSGLFQTPKRIASHASTKAATDPYWHPTRHPPSETIEAATSARPRANEIKVRRVACTTRGILSATPLGSSLVAGDRRRMSLGRNLPIFLHPLRQLSQSFGKRVNTSRGRFAIPL